MKRLLFSWIGRTDLNAAAGKIEGVGPVAQALEGRRFDAVHLLCNYPASELDAYRQWITERTDQNLEFHPVTLSGPMNFREIYEAVDRVCVSVLGRGSDHSVTFHLSPGTSAMAAIWIILAKTRYPAELIQSSLEAGLETAEVPFDISADYLSRVDRKLEERAAGQPPSTVQFGDIVCRSDVMRNVITRARKLVERIVPVLIEGESGTGKELVARAIHNSGPRSAKPFVAVNCGAIPSELIESQFFGHKKGSFTGAVADRVGFFEQANFGTLFLDEIGELPLPAQVALLRVLQEKKVRRVGDTKETGLDVRIIAATNRSLTDEVRSGRFRTDLFFRLAVAVLKLPPLRERQGDLSLLIDELLERIRSEDTGFQGKSLSAGAEQVLMSHSWPGNVRELENTLRRLVVWAGNNVISASEARDAILLMPDREKSILNRPLGSGLDIRALMDEVARHYLERAIEESRGNKTRAAELIGLPSYQRLSYWLDKYELPRTRLS